MPLCMLDPKLTRAESCSDVDRRPAEAGCPAAAPEDREPAPAGAPPGAQPRSPAYQSTNGWPNNPASIAATARNVPNGSFNWRSPLPSSDQRPAHHGPAHGRHRERQQHQGPPEHGADHREHLDVAEPEPFDAPHPVIGLGERPRQPAPEEDANQRGRPAWRQEEARGEPDHDAWQRDHVRQDLVLEVDREQDDEGAANANLTTSSQSGPMTK